MASSLLPNASSPRRLYLVAASVAFAYAPILYFHTKSVWQRTYYQFVPILAVACAYLCWQHLKQPEKYSRMPRLEAALLGVGFVLLLTAVVLFSPWIGALSAIFAAGSLLVYLGGRNRILELLPVWCLLWLMLPPPFGFDIQLVSKLQAFTSVQASRLLDYIGINHLMVGNVLEFPDQRLMVEEACSGMQSLFALFAYTALYVVWRRVPVFRSLLLILTSAFWAGVLNIVRVLAIAIAADRYNIDLSSGWRHEVLGLAVFVMALLMIASTDQWLKLCSSWMHGTVDLLFGGSRIMRTFVAWRDRDVNEKTLECDPLDGFGAWRSSIVCGAFVFVGVSQMGMLGYSAVGGRAAVAVSTEKSDALVLPEQLADWTQTDFKTDKRSASSIFGEHSRIWTYNASFGDVTAAFDYPFGSWHDLRVCYQGTGWTVVSTTKHEAQIEGASAPLEFLEVSMKQTDGQSGYLLFAEFENSGRPVSPMTVADGAGLPLYSYMTEGLKDRWSKSMVDFGMNNRTYQFQMLHTGDAELSAYERSQVIEQFQSALDFAYKATTIQGEQ